jgi:hypothetical protein
MFNELHNHRVAYLILIMILFVHVSLFFVIWPDRLGERVVALTLATSYFCWGIFAHVKAQHITRQIVREYLFASLLAGGMLFFLTL